MTCSCVLLSLALTRKKSDSAAASTSNEEADEKKD